VTDLDEFRKEFIQTTSQRVMRDWVGTGPHLQEGSPAQHAAAIKAPVMLFHGDIDFNVKVAESRLMADRLRDAGKQVELVVYPGLTHGLNTSEALTIASATRRSPACVMRKNRSFCWRGP